MHKQSDKVNIVKRQGLKQYGKYGFQENATVHSKVTLGHAVIETQGNWRQKSGEQREKKRNRGVCSMSMRNARETHPNIRCTKNKQHFPQATQASSKKTLHEDL